MQTNSYDMTIIVTTVFKTFIDCFFSIFFVLFLWWFLTGIILYTAKRLDLGDSKSRVTVVIVTLPLFFCAWYSGYIYDSSGSYLTMWSIAISAGIFASAINFFIQIPKYREPATA